MENSRRTALIFLLSAHAIFPSTASARLITRAEGEVIAAFFNATIDKPYRGKTFVVASASATTERAFIADKPHSKLLAAAFPSATDAVIKDFLRVAGTSADLSNLRELLRSDVRWRFASARTVSRIFSAKSVGESWAKFYMEFPNSSGLTEISRVGIDASSSQAIFFFSMRPEGLGGSGHFVLMQYQSGAWNMVESAIAWVS